MLAADIMSFAIILLMALALCAIVITIEELIWYHKNKSRNTSLKDKKSNKRNAKISINQKTEEKSYNILRFLHIQRLSVLGCAILSFSLFRWIIAIVVWIAISLTSFFVTKKVLKINAEEAKKNKIIISFLQICFWSFGFFVLQLLFSNISFLEYNIKPADFLMYYFYTALTWSSIIIIIFACFYLLQPKRGGEKFHRYVSWITFSIIHLGFQVLWAVTYFNGLVSVS